MKVEWVERHLVEDNPALLKNTIEQAMDADMIILSGGVSMGEADFVPETLQNLGVEKLFHKVKVKPGKPLWFGKKQNGPIVFGIPGNPFSCQVGFLLFIKPLLRECFGQKALKPLFYKAGFERNKKGEMEEYFPCVLAEKDGEVVLQAKAYNGSGDITATAMSDGLARQLSGSSNVSKGDLLAFYPWR